MLLALVPTPVSGLEAVVAALTFAARGSMVEGRFAGVISSGQLDYRSQTR
jgi:hypothetical protein